MTRIAACALAILCLPALTTTARAQDLSMCTATFPVACCKSSYAKYGPFGSATGAAKRAREFDLRVCADKMSKQKAQ